MGKSIRSMSFTLQVKHVFFPLSLNPINKRTWLRKVTHIHYQLRKEL